MSKLVSDLTTALQDSIVRLFPDKVRSKYNWDLTKNAHKKNEKVFAIRPGSLERVAGTTLSATVDQTFSIIFSTSYNDTPANDNDLNDKILELYSDSEEFHMEAFRNNFNIVLDTARVLLVTDFTMDEPNIDFENKTVGLETSFTIKYRTEA